MKLSIIIAYYRPPWPQNSLMAALEFRLSKSESSHQVYPPSPVSFSILLMLLRIEIGMRWKRILPIQKQIAGHLLFISTNSKKMLVVSQVRGFYDNF